MIWVPNPIVEDGNTTGFAEKPVWQQELAARLFEQLNNNPDSYCVLRNYDELPRRWGTDIDVAISSEFAAQIPQLIEKSIDKGMGIEHRINRRSFHQFRIRNGTEDYLQIDLSIALTCIGIPFIQADELVKRSRRYKNSLSIPDPVDEALICLIHPLVGAGIVRPRYREQIYSILQTRRLLFHERVTQLVGESLSSRLLEYFEAGDYAAVEDLRWPFVRRIWLGRIAREPKLFSIDFLSLLYERTRLRIPKLFLFPRRTNDQQ